jgi:hypothetical protein
MRIVFSRDGRGGIVSRVYRRDGVVVELPSYSITHRVPHDLAHAVAERAFGLAGGVYGSLASGAVFSDVRVVGGKPRHDAAARSARLLRANSRDITVAEVVAGALHDAVERGATRAPMAKLRHDWGIVREDPFPGTDEQAAAALATLTALTAQWETLPADGTIEFEWPDRLVRPVPPEPGSTRR